MFVVGLTGGIGSGKSTFAALLAERGAQVIDADHVGHEILRPSTPAWNSVVDQFGDEILVPETLEISRRRLAAIVFSDPRKLAALNAITHPRILARIAEELEKLQHTDEIVVLDAALIVEIGLTDSLDCLIVVDASDEVRKARLINHREMAAADIDARIAAQAKKADVLAKADVVVINDGDFDALASEADRVWAELQERQAGGG